MHKCHSTFTGIHSPFSYPVEQRVGFLCSVAALYRGTGCTDGPRLWRCAGVRVRGISPVLGGT